MKGNNVEKAVRAMRAGRIVIVTDDQRRENEGDLIAAAEKISPRTINFMARNGRGLICVAMSGERLARLGLERMTQRGRGDVFSTAFMNSVDAARGITTGISAHDRAKTVAVLASPRSKAPDLVSPGHMFPLEAVRGGVLRRAGHTEASVDLARLAGLAPAAVICEILKRDGTMARMPDLVRMSRLYRLPMLTIADLIAYRRRNERLVERVRTVQFPTRHGLFVLHLYRSMSDGNHHIAIVAGDVDDGRPVLVRVHSECLTGDVLGSLRCDCGTQLQRAMEMVGKEGRGAILYMRQEGRGIGLANKIHAYELQDRGLDTVEANVKLGFPADLREYGEGAQMLADLGIRHLRLITNNPRKIVGLEGYGLKVVERVPLVSPATPFSRRYLKTKKQKLGHML